MKLTNTMEFVCGFLAFVIASVQVSASEQERAAYQLPEMTFEKDPHGFFVNVAPAAYRQYMWESFVALNWPARVGRRGEPDTTISKPAARSPLVWETMAQPQQVFVPFSEWPDYPTWNDLKPIPGGLTIDEAVALCTGFNPKTDIILADINQPHLSIRDGPVAPLMDQHRRYVRYQITLNRVLFEYIREHGYFDATAQKKSVRASQRAQYLHLTKPPPDAFVPLPVDEHGAVGMLETKSAWRMLDPIYDDPSRYYVRSGYYLSPDRSRCGRAPAGFGLVSLHIHRATQLSHVATTFEHIDNVETNTPEILPSFNPGRHNTTQTNIWPPYGNLGFDGTLPPLITKRDVLPPRHRRQPNHISRAVPIPSAVRALNAEYHARYADTVLKYYQMINVQHVREECRMRRTGNFSTPVEWRPANCPTPNTQRLINTALESYTQLVNPFDGQPFNYSCHGCHENARPCGFQGPRTPALTFRPDFHVMSFLLSKAMFPGQLRAPDNYSCNDPASQPPHGRVNGRRVEENIDR